MPGPKPRKKPTKESTPEQVAAYESMKPGYGKSGENPYPKKATLKHNIAKKSYANKPQVDKMFTLDLRTMRQRPISQMALEQMAYRLVTWATSKKQIILDDFLQLEGYEYDTFAPLRKRCPKLEEAYQFAKMCIGNKRERDAYYNRGNPSLIMKSMPSYSKRWTKLYEWHASLTQKDSDKPSQTLVVIDKAVETTIVPPLKKDDKDE